MAVHLLQKLLRKRVWSMIVTGAQGRPCGGTLYLSRQQMTGLERLCVHGQGLVSIRPWPSGGGLWFQ